MSRTPEDSEGRWRDPGLQPERTELAWQRTALAATGLVLVIALTALRVGSPRLAVPATGLALAVLVLATVRARRSGRADTADGTVAIWPALVWVVAVVVLVAALGLLLEVHTLTGALY